MQHCPVVPGAGGEGSLLCPSQSGRTRVGKAAQRHCSQTAQLFAVLYSLPKLHPGKLLVSWRLWRFSDSCSVVRNQLVHTAYRNYI